MTVEKKKPLKSVITCDMEGRIETFGKGAVRLFGYEAEEVVGKQRVSFFSPGLIVLGHVGNWLKVAREEGESNNVTVFRRKDGTLFPAEIRITTTHRDGEQIGYCGQTREIEGMSVKEAMPPISLWTRILAWLIITRAPFLTASLVPVCVAAGWVAYQQTAPFAWGLFGLTLLGAAMLQVSANTFNDYYDWKHGTDQANTSYFQGFSGGSRAIELGLISARGMWWVGALSALVAFLAGILVVWLRGPMVLAFGFAGLAAGYFYTAPPLRLVARRGLGELTIALTFGPLITAGTAYVLAGQVGWMDYVIGLPIGLLTAAILWINQYPDAESDALTGKNHLVVVLGKERARWGYAALLAAAFTMLVAMALLQVIPLSALVALLALPLAFLAARGLFAHYQDRALVDACKATIYLQLAVGLLMALGLSWPTW